MDSLAKFSIGYKQVSGYGKKKDRQEKPDKMIIFVKRKYYDTLE